MSEIDPRSTKNIALLIDADNASPASFDAALTVLAELGNVNIRRAYGNWSKASLRGWADMVHRFAIEPQQQFDVTKGKSATDVRMTIDAMDLLFRGNVDGFGIMSSDSDFMPLAMRIRQEGIPVYGFGTAKTPQSFKQACTRFIDVGALEQASREALPQDLGTAGEQPPVATADPELIELFDGAWKASKRDDRGFARLSEVGERAGNRSSFDTRNYGVSRLSDLIATLPNFVTEKRDDGSMWVKRVR